MRRADADERTRLNALFGELCAIASPSGSERACAERVTAELDQLGLSVEEDAAGSALGGDCGNLLARIPAGGAQRSVLLCSHLDTVAPEAALAPDVFDGVWQNANAGILGADNKAAVAVMLAIARRCASESPPIGIELLFTVAEEDALAGAKAFDVGRLRSEYGYVFDHATPIGEVIVAAPTYYRIEAIFRGTAAHAGVRPEEGRNAVAAAAAAIAAMTLGRLDPVTTANVASIEGGPVGTSATNVVPDRCRVLAETRSLDRASVESVVAEMVDHLHDGANARECDLDVDVQRLFEGYRQRATEAPVRAADRALRACGYEPKMVPTGGASDANALNAAGFACLNLANGTERNHQPDERVTVAALEEMLDVGLALLDAAAVESDAA